ncbi:hypothetical protein IEQ34_017752 [Dendrobium chrysotoxum]|uniref:Uncharacterized protein n=1 Tax=Dendrobium chrysotoxum TaxID=161865 RepID=A0AAV7GCB8_DENCH|nr:hypothetical protein IEQ34_017752 [Dendrobium chrysotoxum]
MDDIHLIDTKFNLITKKLPQRSNFGRGTIADTKTATAIFSGKASMALAKLNPPKLCPTSTTFSPSATEAIKSIRGWAYSSKVETSSGILRGSEPQAARSTAVTEYP